jgi:hypothetical protein
MKKAFFILLFISIPSFLFAQWNELGIALGVSNYKGELSATMFNTYFIHPAGGVFFRHNINRRWSYRLMADYLYISGSDSKSTIPYNVNRNLSFESSIIDVSGFFEFNFLPYETGTKEKKLKWTPYLFSGLSIFRFNPKADYNGDLISLHDLGTEGQNLPGNSSYSLISYALPIGGGIKMSLGRVGLSIELCARRTYTDYLDDVSNLYPDKNLLLANGGPVAVAMSDRSLPSPNPADSLITIYPGKQRGSPENDDWYLFAGATIFIRLGGHLQDPCKQNFIRKKY